MPAPRPILKSLRSSFLLSEAASNPLPFSSCSTILDSPHVHFPPTPALTSTEVTHSAFNYDRAPIVVAPNACALPERGGRNFTGGQSNQGGLGYFHTHAKFQVDVERDFSEKVSSPILSASATVGNVNDCGSVGLYRRKWSGPMYDYDCDSEYDQCSSHYQRNQHAQHVISSLISDPSSESLELGVFWSPPAPSVPTPSSSSSPNSSIPNSSVNIPPINVYDSSSLTSPSPSSTASNNFTASRFYENQHGRKSLFDGKKRRKSREYPHYRAEGESQTGDWTQWTMLLHTDSDGTSRELELEGCLGGF